MTDSRVAFTLQGEASSCVLANLSLAHAPGVTASLRVKFLSEVDSRDCMESQEETKRKSCKSWPQYCTGE